MHTYGAVLLVGGYSKIPGKYVTTLEYIGFTHFLSRLTEKCRQCEEVKESLASTTSQLILTLKLESDLVKKRHENSVFVKKRGCWKVLH